MKDLNHSTEAALDRKGLGYCLLVYTLWGLYPLYWKLFGQTSPMEIVCHRAIWSLASLVVFMFFSGQWREVLAVFTDRRQLGFLAAAAYALSINWGCFIAAVGANRVVEVSLGYFFCPLVSVFVAWLFLKERLRPLQKVAVLLAFAGVVLFGWSLGAIPWYALGLAISFGFYGLLRKMAPASPMVGLLVESLLMMPVALVIVWFLAREGKTAFGSTPGLTLLFISSGAVTTGVLIWYHRAVKLLPLATVGILQYLTPFLQLLIGLAVFHEPFRMRDGAAFGLIWVAIALYLWPTGRRRRQSAEKVLPIEP